MKHRMILSLGVVIFTSNCSEENCVHECVYRSLDSRSVFIINDGNAYIGPASYPESKNVAKEYGSPVLKFKNPDNLECERFPGVTVSKVKVNKFVCDGSEFTREDVNENGIKTTRVRVICPIFKNRQCYYKVTSKAESEISYDIADDDHIARFYMAGYSLKDRSNTFELVYGTGL